MRILTAIALILLFSTTVADAQTTRDNGAYAIVDVRIEVGDGAVIDRGTIVLRDGVIQAVGTDIKIPPDAELIKGTGLVAYPGFIDAGVTRGLKLPDWQPDQDHVPDTTSFAPPSMREANRKWVRPELRAADCLALTDAILGPMRKNGFCAALFVPAGGIIQGVSTLALLNGAPRRETVVRGSVGLHMSFNPGDGSPPGPRAGSPPGGGGYPGSLLGIIADLRQTLMDAGHHRALQAGYARGVGVRPPFDECLDALLPALDGKVPTLFNADSKTEIDRAIRLADEFHLQLVLTGAGEAWKESSFLSQKGIPVLASLNFGDEPGAPRPRTPSSRGAGRSPATGAGSETGGDVAAGQPPAETPPPPDPKDEDDTPRPVIDEQHKKWEERVANAAQLDRKGVRFALTTTSLRGNNDFWRNLRRAIKSGLPKSSALSALTINSATILGVDRQLGTLSAGKMANVLLMTGDFADPGSKVKYLIIDRTRFEPDAEQTPASGPPSPVPAEIDEGELP